MAQPPRISQAEWEVMNVLWQRGQATAAEVVADLAGRKAWKEGTVKTLLNRLLRKGVLASQSQGKSYLYRPRANRAACIRQESRSFLQRVFAGREGAMLVHLVETADLTPREIDELRRLLSAKKEDRP